MIKLIVHPYQFNADLVDVAHIIDFDYKAGNLTFFIGNMLGVVILMLHLMLHLSFIFFFSLFSFWDLFMTFSVGSMIKLTSLSQIFVCSSEFWFQCSLYFLPIFAGAIFFISSFILLPGCILHYFSPLLFIKRKKKISPLLGHFIIKNFVLVSSSYMPNLFCA